MKKIKIILPFFLFVFSLIQAQTKLNGKVTNSEHQPIANARIYLDSIYTKVQTNKNGEFEVTIAKPVKVINVYAAQYGLLTSAYGNENTINFMFLETQKLKKIKNGTDDNITLGYSKDKNSYQILSKQNINSESDRNAATYNTIYDMIRGRLSGVTVSRDNKITIRGITSIRNTTEPLFVIDGIIASSIDYLVPNNIKNIRVLKGAEASIYGSQGSSGAIIFTTKK